MERYYRLQVGRLLEDSLLWKTRIKSMKDGIVTYRGNNLDEIEDEIEKLEIYTEVVESAKSMFDKPELELIMCPKNCRIVGNRLEDISERHGISYAEANTRRNEALKDMQCHLEGFYSELFGEYYDFEIVKFIRDSGQWAEQIAEYEAEKDELMSLNAVSSDGSGVSGTRISDTTGTTVAKMLRVDEKIHRITQYQTELLKYIKRLSDEEYDVLIVYNPQCMSGGRECKYRKGKRTDERRAKFEADYHCSRGTADRKNEVVLNYIKHGIIKDYFRPMEESIG